MVRSNPTPTGLPATLGELRESGWRSRTVKEELRANLVRRLAAGRPVVATRVGGLPEVVGDGETGVLVSPDDPRGFVRAVTDLLDDPLRLRRLGATARERAMRCFDWQRHVDAYDELYRRMAA